MRRLVLACAWLVMVLPATALAGKADVLKVAVSQQGETYRFDVTVAHEDTGWDHYADAWEVVGPDGKVIPPACQSAIDCTLVEVAALTIPPSAGLGSFILDQSAVFRDEKATLQAGQFVPLQVLEQLVQA